MELPLGIGAGIARAVDHLECTICFDPLTSRAVSVCCARDRKRVCSHYFHSDCISAQVKCPICRRPYDISREMPHPLENPSDWFDFVDVDGDESLSINEVVWGLQASLLLDFKKIDKG